VGAVLVDATKHLASQPHEYITFAKGRVQSSKILVL
jgi:hypothetical protein